MGLVQSSLDNFQGWVFLIFPGLLLLCCTTLTVNIFSQSKIRFFQVRTSCLWSFLSAFLRRIWFCLFCNSPLASRRLHLDPSEFPPGRTKLLPSVFLHRPCASAPDHPRGPWQDLSLFVKLLLALPPREHMQQWHLLHVLTQATSS